MSFEEEFPSLHQRRINAVMIEKERNVYTEAQISHHCLDKQRVRATMKTIKKYIPSKVRTVEEANFSLSKLRTAIDAEEEELGL